ncbi:transcriptional regulator, TetR family [Jatrophihabitans endophyticus]|uniref:Transcriptional regulator, TetR family n=1 Tax=Jatrophihabitans endophyticus TaxID=1206085 RepID=A0A1M5EV54_9ACTN|nr:TetR/AcrR family transcriptional regulator [Jatrophihabitans endophyticus]SHF83049.1 transcriptional regulator, TetR family [Jatrophihabitans endophyticus]
MASVAQSEVGRGARLPRSARRKQLLAAAQAVFVANGYHAAAMDDIAERAGVSKPVLYQHFPGKRELYLALLDTQAAALADAVVQALATTDDNQQRIHAVLSAYFSFVDRDDHDGAFRLIFESDLVNDPEVRNKVESVTERTMTAVADTVAADTGLGRPEAELLATALTGSAQVVARWWLASDRPVSQDDAIALLESLLWRGISNFPRQG